MRAFARGLVIALVLVPVLKFAVPWGYHVWYVDTHCTMVLGTQVCR